MGQDSKIEWTHHTFNPWRGCTKVSAGCANCYAETQSRRNPSVLGVWGPGGTRVVAAEAYWQQPLRWNRAAAAAGARHRVFCASLADVFEERPELVEPRMRLFKLIGSTPHLDWLLLTKRPRVAVEHWPLWCGYWCSAQADSAAVLRVADGFVLPNVWLGASVEDQKAADERIPELLKCPAAVRFLSVEPLLGPISLMDVKANNGEHDYLIDCLNGLHGVSRGESVDWVIVGGESGHGARPMHPHWAEYIRDQCRDARVPFFFKQWGEFRTTTFEEAEADDPRIVTIKETPDADDSDKWPMTRVGKKAAGRLLDGREWSEFPRVEVPA